jgi:hypothetical protein
MLVDQIKPFLLDFPTYYNISFQNILYYPQDFNGIFCNIPFLVSNFINLGILLLFSSAKVLSILFAFSKNQLLFHWTFALFL